MAAGLVAARTERTCSGSGSCGLLSGVLLPPATPRTGEPAEVSAWPGAGAVGNPSSVSDRLFSWSISLGERGATLARGTGGYIQPLPLRPAPGTATCELRPSWPGPWSFLGRQRSATLGCDTAGPGGSRSARQSPGPEGEPPTRGCAPARGQGSSCLMWSQPPSPDSFSPPVPVRARPARSLCPVPSGAPRQSAAAEPDGVNRGSAGLRDKRAPLKLGRRLGKANKDKA